MAAKRVLLMHISNVSGHRSASLAIGKALRQVDGNVQTRTIDAFNYLSPFGEKLISGFYMFVIEAVPGLWNYLYDNEAVYKRSIKIRSAIHSLSDKKLENLFYEFRPDVVVCTQAFPCGLVADYKKRHNLDIPLIGVLTDYASHLYWLDDFVDIYVVPAPKIERMMIQRGVPCERLKVLGIPIDTKFRQETNREEIFRRLGLNPHLAVILIMGGGQGLGPIKEIVRTLDKLSHPVQLVVVCGTNRRLFKWLNKNKTSFKKAIAVIGYTDNVGDLMAISTLVVSKPGGLSSSEALSKSLPIIIVNPLPGQENMNTRFLSEAGVALKVENFSELQSLTQELLRNKIKLKHLRQRAKSFSQPDSALKIAHLILDTVKQRNIENQDVISSL